MSKVLSPKAWYLVGIGAVALAADGVRRLVRKRREEAGQKPLTGGTSQEEHIPVMKSEPTVESKPAVAAKLTETQPAAKPSQAAKPVKSGGPDDLTAIKGIGPTLAKRLADAGITSYAAIADASPDYLREVTNAPAVANPEEWIAQAREMA